MICKNCGNEIRDDAKFCPHCGALGGEAPACAGPEAPVPGKGKKGLFIGGIAAAVVAVIALVAVLAGGLSSTPKDQLGKAMGKTFAAYEAAGDRMGMPDLNQLTEARSISQRFSLRLNSVNSALLGYDASALSGLGLRMNTDLDGGGRKMGFELGAFWGEEDIVSFQVLADDEKLYVSSPEITNGTAYGVNTETLGADMTALGAEDVGDVSFNLFDLVDIAAPQGRVRELKDKMKAANQALWEAVQVEKGGTETITLHGNETRTQVYQALIPQQALEDYADAWVEIYASLNYMELYEEMLKAAGLPREEIDRVMGEIRAAEPYEYLSDSLKDLLAELGDVKLTVCVGDGCVSAVKYEDCLFEDDTHVAAELYLGGGGEYVDDLRLEVEVDGQKIVLDSNGDHSGKSGVFTDETTIKGPFPAITSEYSYDPKGADNNLRWELNIVNAGSLEVEGRLTTGKDSLDLRLEDMTLRVMGLEICSLGMDYYAGPCQGVDLPAGSPKLVGEMESMELMVLMVQMQANAQSWLESTQQMFARRLPAELYESLF